METLLSIEDSHVEVLHEIGVRLATADGFHEVLARIVDFASALVKCDSCLIYVLEGEELVLRASKNPHPDAIDRLKLHVGEGITGWVAENKEPVAVSEHAAQDPRFLFFNELPEDNYEAFLSVPLMCRGQRGRRDQLAASSVPRLQETPDSVDLDHRFPCRCGN